jgi:hypothetical protein
VLPNAVSLNLNAASSAELVGPRATRVLTVLEKCFDVRGGQEVQSCEDAGTGRNLKGIEIYFELEAVKSVVPLIQCVGVQCSFMRGQ